MAENEPVASDRRRLYFLAGGVGVTAGLLALALAMGGWAFSYRRLSLHDGRLQRLVDARPTFSAAREGLLLEPEVREIALTDADADLRRVGAPFPAAQVTAMLSKKRRWTEARAFAVQDLVYILYLDGAGVVRDYALLHPE